MVLYLNISILIFLIIFLTGFTSLSIMQRLGFNISPNVSFIYIFFTGFIIISLLSSYLSIIIPVNYKLALSLFGLCVMGLIVFRKKLSSYLLNFKKLSVLDLFIMISVLLIVVAISSLPITHFDTALYATQAIKWINQYPVITGLGNLHTRFAFNSMFFPISSTFLVDGLIETKEVLMYSLNTITFYIFLMWQYFNLKIQIKQKNLSGIVLISILIFLGLSFLTIGWLNSPSADVITAILILYVFQLLTTHQLKNETQLIFITSIVFLCITFKLSASLLALVILLFLRKKTLQRDIITIVSLGIIIFLPFFIRNYYLSGYLIYPFVGIDIFDIDWKISAGVVSNEASWIESWAKIPRKTPNEVLSLSLTEWIPIWFHAKTTLVKQIIITSFSLPLIAVILLIQRNKNEFVITMILIMNLLFWMINAPDPRFSYGILFFSTAYFFYVTIKIIPIKIFKNLVFFAVLLVIINHSVKHIPATYKSLKHHYRVSSNLVIPHGFVRYEPVQIYEEFSNFKVYKPTSKNRCYNAQLPCTPYLSNNLILIGDHIKEGFTTKNK